MKLGTEVAQRFLAVERDAHPDVVACVLLPHPRPCPGAHERLVAFAVAHRRVDGEAEQQHPIADPPDPGRRIVHQIRQFLEH
jgi:hypothetical protein